MKNFFKSALCAISCVLVAIIAATLLMTAVYAIPTDRIRENVNSSIGYFYNEDDGYWWAPGIDGTHYDNFTDSLMLNAAAFPNGNSAVRDAMNNPHYDFEGEVSKSMNLAKAVSGTADPLERIRVNYPRYWHGYLLWLKPLLCVMTMSELRVLSMCFQFVLAAVLLIVLYKRYGIRIAIPFGLVILSLNPVSTALCMQYASIYIIMLVFALVMILTGAADRKNYWMLFLWMGVATAFFDFLTYPLAALGVCQLLMLAVTNETLTNNIKKTVFSGMAWGFGYAGMWVGKWAVASLLTGKDVFQYALSKVFNRLSGESLSEAGIDSSTPKMVIGYNLDDYKNKVTIIIGIAFIITLVVLAIVKKSKIRFNAGSGVVQLLIGLYPFVWYSVVRNHSAIHAWFTHRLMAITFFAVGLVLYSIFDTRGMQDPVKEGPGIPENR